MKKQFLIFLLIFFTTETNQSIGVFCSADDKIAQNFKKCAFEIGKTLAKNKLILVTGGSNTGLMKEVMDGYCSIKNHLQPFGVLPEALKKYNITHPAIPENNLIWCETIHTRLKKFHTKCDVIIALPGGFGTLHELLDFLVHQQFGLIQKKIILYNYNHFWDFFVQQLKYMCDESTLTKKHLSLLNIANNQDELYQFLFSNNEVAHHGLDEHYWEK